MGGGSVAALAAVLALAASRNYITLNAWVCHTLKSDYVDGPVMVADYVQYLFMLRLGIRLRLLYAFHLIMNAVFFE